MCLGGSRFDLDSQIDPVGGAGTGFYFSSAGQRLPGPLVVYKNFAI